MTWSHSGDLFLLTNGVGRVKIYGWPDLNLIHTLDAHTSNCFCLEFDPRGRYLAVGGADAIVSLWDLKEWISVRTFDRQEYLLFLSSKRTNSSSWPIRTLSFSYDGVYLASGSEDSNIDIAYVETGLEARKVPTTSAINSLAWHPGKHWLAYAGEDKEGSLRILAFQDSK
jgi:THO complex subunit 3